MSHCKENLIISVGGFKGNGMKQYFAFYFTFIYLTNGKVDEVVPGEP